MQDLGYNKNRRLFLRIGETVCGFFGYCSCSVFFFINEAKNYIEIILF